MNIEICITLLMYLIYSVFKKFHKNIHKKYDLCSVRFVTVYHFRGCLHWRDEIEFLADIDILHLYKERIREGLTTAIKHYAEANNEYINSFDLSNSSLFIIYFTIDKNNYFLRTIKLEQIWMA